MTNPGPGDRSDETRLAQLVGRSLQAQAQQAPAPVPELDRVAQRRARRIRRTHRIGASVAVAAVAAAVALIAPSAIELVGSPADRADVLREGEPPPEDRPADEEEPTDEEEPAGEEPIGAEMPVVTLDFAELETGPLPLPYWSAEDGGIHDQRAGASAPFVPYGVEPAGFMGVGPTAANEYVVRLHDGASRLLLLDADGAASPLGDLGPDAYTAARSPSGERLAWVGEDPDHTALSWLQISELDRGEQVARMGIDASSDVVGYLGEDHVVVNPASEAQPIAVDPVADESFVIPGKRAFATAPTAGLVAVGTGTEETADGVDSWCSVVLRGVPNGGGGPEDGLQTEQVWESCELRPVAFSPDGRYLIAQPGDTEGLGPGSYTVLAVDSGEEVLRVEADWLNRVAWTERGDGFVVEAFADGEFALVTCELSGECRLGTEPVPTDPPADLPYVLVTDPDPALEASAAAGSAYRRDSNQAR